MRVSIVGVHPVAEADEPCHLIELRVDECREPIDLGSFTQEIAGQPRVDWQVPYDEHILNSEGTQGEPCFSSSALRVEGGARLAFFFHYLNLLQPLATPAGPIALPPETSRPDRLGFMKYEQP